MRKIYWLDPVDELRRMQYRMDRLFKDVFEPSYMGRRLLPSGTEEELVTTAEPYVDLIERDKELVLKADIPGVGKDDIKIDVRGNRLEITAERKDEKEEKDDGYLRKERTFTKYSRSITLPTEILPEKVEATFEDGVLKLTIPKTEVEGTKRIEIK